MIHNVYGIDIFASNIDTAISISDTKMTVEYGYEETVKEEYEVTWETVNMINYMSFYYDGNFMGENINHGRKKYIVFRGSYFLIFYNSNNKMEYAIEGGKGPMDSSSICNIVASSELQEGNITYNVNNLFNIDELEPWVEGASGNMGLEKKYELR
jgi:hypothetical protein